MSFTSLQGKRVSIKLCGERTFFAPGKSSRYRYYLSPTFRIMRDICSERFMVRLRLRVRITDAMGRALLGTAAQARRKHVTRDWWNHEWVSRYLAFCSFLADGKEEIMIGDEDQYRVVISARPTTFTSRLSLNEAKIEERLRRRKMRTI